MSTKPSPYVPSFLKAAAEGVRPLQLTFSEVKDTNILSTSSFIYDAPDAPLKSTQQLNVDWSKFENHTFFMSAQAKVNLAFEQIINGFPFDGTRQEVETFFEKLTGFDRYVFDEFPKFHGQLHFTGTTTTETLPTAGSYIIVKDSAGALYPELAKTQHGQAVLNPVGTSLSFELHIKPPQEATAGTQVICQKMYGLDQGFCLYLTPTVSTTNVDANFAVVSGSTCLDVSCALTKGAFNHICVVLNKETSKHYLQFFVDGELISTSKKDVYFGDFNINASDFIIGSGSAFTLNGSAVTPTQTFSGSIDELRVFHSARSYKLQQQYAAKNIFAQPELKLYYKFNEPPPPLVADNDSANAIVIDSSGNSLHSMISNFSLYADYDTGGYITGSVLRENASTDPASKLIYEKQESVPVLFPAYQDVVDLNTVLLSSASQFDDANPNLVTKLVPPHFLLEGALFDGYSNPECNGGQPYTGGIPGQGKNGGVQLLLSLLYIYARFFDEMKLYIDAFNTLKTVDYNTNVSMPNNFLRDLVKQYGFNLPPMFNDSTLEQYVEGENIGQDISSSETPLKHVQNELLRRVLINLPEVIRSKGTQHSIKVFLRAVGIDPENSVRLREYGGPTTRQLSFAREFKRNVSTMVEFTSSSLAITPFLSASRVEPGVPQAAGTFVKQQSSPKYISNNASDGLMTSGSWTVESIVKYTPVNIANMENAAQSLVRFCVTGSSMSDGPGLIANFVVVSSSVDPYCALYVRPGTDASSPLLTLSMSLPNNAVFDGDKWNVSFGCERNDTFNSSVSSSYFIRVATQNVGEITTFLSTSSLFYETISGGDNVFRKLSTTNNASGSFIAIGSNHDIPSSVGTNYYLNDPSECHEGTRAIHFNGRMSDLRFWSKALSETEWKEHVRNHKSTGITDPKTNWNYENTASGSFERLRLESFTKQETRRANATASLGELGSITFIDFTTNNLHLTGTGFPIESDSLIGELFDVSYISPYFDEAVTNEKIRIRSFQDELLVAATPWANIAPVNELVKSEQPTDDVRFSIEFSLIDALNRDIITMFSTLDAVDNAIGNPELVYSPDYPQLETLRNIYFNRIKEKLNFKSFFEFYRWFDTSIGTFIEQLVPRKTNFKGTNFIIESHMLERHKLEYQGSEIYLGEEDRSRIKDVLLLQQIAGSVHKF
jgi:hypothetical protein